jgi:hypothetical protein
MYMAGQDGQGTAKNNPVPDPPPQDVRLPVTPALEAPLSISIQDRPTIGPRERQPVE